MNALASERLSQYVRYVIHPAGYDTKLFVVLIFYRIDFNIIVNINI